MLEDLNQEIKGWLKEGFELTTVLRRLDKRGVPQNVALLAYRQAFNEYSKEKIKRKRPIYIGIALGLFSLFLFVIPITWTGHSPILFGGLAGLILAFFVVQAIDVFSSFTDFVYRMSLPATDKSIKTPAFVMVLLPVVLWLAFSMYYPTEVDREISNYGVNVKGNVGSGISRTTSTRRTSVTTNTVFVTFRLKSGKTFTGATEISTSEFENTYIGEEVTVRYSSKHPEFFKVVIPKKEPIFKFY